VIPACWRGRLLGPGQEVRWVQVENQAEPLEPFRKQCGGAATADLEGRSALTHAHPSSVQSKSDVTIPPA
jgi:hypothetical protein